MDKIINPLKNNTPTGSKWYLNRTIGGYQQGIYYSSEVREIPYKIRSEYIQSLSSAHREGVIIADLTSAGNLNEVDFYAPVDKDGKQQKLRGVRDGIAPGFSKRNTPSETSESTKPSINKLGNALRDNLQEKVKFSTEDSLRAKVAAAKAANNK